MRDWPILAFMGLLVAIYVADRVAGWRKARRMKNFDDRETMQ